MPAGFIVDGLPVGLEMLGGAYTEPRLLDLAYAWERAATPRRAPFSTPALVDGKAGLSRDGEAALAAWDKGCTAGAGEACNAAAMAMRQVLVNHAEASLAEKRGGGVSPVSLDEAGEAVQREANEVLALHEALDRLSLMDGRKAKVVELRYFGGLSTEETAEALGVSVITVARDWQAARAWLARELGASPS